MLFSIIGKVGDGSTGDGEGKGDVFDFVEVLVGIFIGILGFNKLVIENELFWKENWSGFDNLLCKNLFFCVNGFNWLLDSEIDVEGVVSVC
jgi:hypothetical protein